MNYNQIITGSSAFFSGIEGFKSKDTDIIILVDATKVKYKWHYQIFDDGGRDVFKIVIRPKEELIEHTLEKEDAMCVCRYLTPDYAKAINFEIEDLKKLQPLVDRMDSKHMYLVDIYNAYIENNDFVLSNEQRMKAFETYKNARKHESRN